MHRNSLLFLLVPLLILAGCAAPSASPTPARTVSIIEYPPLNWSLGAQRLRDTGCEGKLADACAELIALGCDETSVPGFYIGGLQPPYAVMECIHASGEPPNREYFRQPAGMDTRLRSFAVWQDGRYRLIIRKSEFQAIFAPVDSTDEAISFAMALSSLSARFDLDPHAQVDYLVDVIQETHAEQTPDGTLVYLFDTDREMGCGEHSFYAVQVLVTPEGQAHEVERQEIYKSYACFDFGALRLED
jgi:hypothetical protein